ncbi:MAG: Periplasmic binding protein [Acidimicrobiales bacterium]|nr:Periplasmic binding protein [Acidimicrobiales bacterium]
MRAHPLVAVAAVALLAVGCAKAPTDAKAKAPTGASKVGTFAGTVTAGPDGRLLPTKCTGTSAASPKEGVATDSVNVASLAVNFADLAKIGFSAANHEPPAVYAEFVKALNAKGGVCGRKIQVQQISYDIIKNEGGKACVQATQDQTNLVVNTSSFDQITCITDAGVPAYSASDLTKDDVARSKGLLFSRSPLVEQQYVATVEYAKKIGALKGKVGVWYGNIFPNLGDAAEKVVLPLLKKYGVDFKAYRTDSAGPSEPDGNAVLTSAATDIVARKVDTMLMFVGPTNYTGMQSELHAQHLDPRYVSAPVAGNSSNEIFAKQFGTQSYTDGQAFVTYTQAPNELGPDNPIAKSCNDQWTKLTGQKVKPNTFDYALVTSDCVQVDELAAALSLAGGNLTRERIVQALAGLPSHAAPSNVGPLHWTPTDRTAAPEFSVQIYHGKTNTVTTDKKTFKVAG